MATGTKQDTVATTPAATDVKPGSVDRAAARHGLREGSLATSGKFACRYRIDSFVAQQGAKHAKAKPLKGYRGAGVLEVVSDYKGDTFRTIYTVRLAGAVYVLHAFQKKSKHGRETPKADLDLIEMRLRDAERVAAGDGASRQML